MDWISLVIGGVVGAIFSILGQEIWNKHLFSSVLKRSNILKRHSLLEGQTIYDWIESYYVNAGKESDLYLCKIGSEVMRIPFLTSHKFSNINLSISEFSSQFIFAGQSDRSFSIFNHLVRRRKALGQILFDEPTIYLDSIRWKDNKFIVIGKSCRYFEMFSLLAKIEEETYSSMSSGKKQKTPVRDKILPNFETASQVKHRPISIGCQVAMFFRTQNSWEILLQVRSHSTITFGGTSALIPVFGLSPIGESCGEELILHNIVKEYCEELFDYEDLIKIANSRRPSPLWFLKIREAKEFTQGMNESKIKIFFNGMGFDGLNASLTLSFAVIIEQELSCEIKDRINANWEVATTEEAELPIEFIDYRSPKLGDLLRSKSLHVGSAFSISRGLQMLDAGYYNAQQND